MHDSNHLIRSRLALLVAAVISCLLFSPGPAAAQGAAVRTSPQPGSTQPVDIIRDPTDVPPPVGDRQAATVRVALASEEVVGELDPATDTTYRYWTFNGKVPGPMIRVRQGDTVEVTLRNDASSRMVHSVDFHAALGPGGGAALSQVLPGQQKTFTFEATTPGLFVYHCGTSMIADHIANGMYGLILVEPAGGLAHVDHEFYVMQGEVYTTAAKGKAGLQAFSEAKLMQESPEYFVFNGAVDALTKEHPLRATTGETVRILFGNAGPNGTSSLHVVGEIFARDYLLGSLTSPPVSGVQTASVPPGSAAILELTTAMPGQYAFMDHAMARMAKGLMGTLDVRGEPTAQLMHAGPASAVAGLEQSAAAGSPPTAEIIHKGDTEPAPATPDAAGMSGGAGHMDTMMHMDHSQQPPSTMTTKASGAREFRSQVSHLGRPAVAQLDGCLTLDEVPRLKLFHSPKSYRLEPRPMLLTESPLAFADNNHALVQITGHWDRDAGSGGEHWFVVESIEQLSLTCAPNQSLAQLRKTAVARLAEVSAAPTGALTVGMSDMAFLQPDIVVNVGQAVTWKNTSSIIHNVVADPALATVVADVHLPAGARTFDSGMLQPGQAFAHTFTVPGVYRYVCTLHEANGMKGIVVVKAAETTNMARADTPSQK